MDKPTVNKKKLGLIAIGGLAPVLAFLIYQKILDMPGIWEKIPHTLVTILLIIIVGVTFFTIVIVVFKELPVGRALIFILLIIIILSFVLAVVYIVAPPRIDDTDQDGVPDYRDKCPHNQPVEISKGVDSSGCPLDRDQDGVPDYRDSCPDTPPGIKVKPNGCPVLDDPIHDEPTPLPYRYSDNGDGTITDNRTGLIWLKNANCFGRQTWDKAKEVVAKLTDGKCDLNDGSKVGDWHLPTIYELGKMVDDKYEKPSLSNAAGTGQWKKEDAFLGVQSNSYWSSTMYTNIPDNALFVNFNDGLIGSYTLKTVTLYVWPVRGR